MSFFNLQFFPYMVTFFSTWPLFLKFDRNCFLRATFLQVLSFSAGGLPYFGTSVAIPKTFFKQLCYFIYTFCFKIVFNKKLF